jgi:hypothetical protein
MQQKEITCTWACIRLSDHSVALWHAKLLYVCMVGSCFPSRWHMQTDPHVREAQAVDIRKSCRKHDIFAPCMRQHATLLHRG